MTVRTTKRANDEERAARLDAWREQATMARRESRNAYLGFLDSLFDYYRESVRIAEMADRRR